MASVKEKLEGTKQIGALASEIRAKQRLSKVNMPMIKTGSFQTKGKIEGKSVLIKSPINRTQIQSFTSRSSKNSIDADLKQALKQMIPKIPGELVRGGQN